MKRFACGDIVPGCEAAWQADDERALLCDVAGHAATAHGLSTISDATLEAIREHIHEIV